MKCTVNLRSSRVWKVSIRIYTRTFQCFIINWVLVCCSFYQCEKTLWPRKIVQEKDWGLNFRELEPWRQRMKLHGMAHPQWHTFSLKTTSPNPSHTLSPNGEQGFKCMGQCCPFSLKPPHSSREKKVTMKEL